MVNLWVSFNLDLDFLSYDIFVGLGLGLFLEFKMKKIGDFVRGLTEEDQDEGQIVIFLWI